MALTFAVVAINSWNRLAVSFRAEVGLTSRRALRMRDRIDIRYEAKGIKMATQRAIDEADIRRRMGKWAEAIRTMDLDSVTSNYAPDIASFDLGPPLRHAGAQAKRKNWVGVFGMFQRPLDYELRDLTIAVCDEVAFAHSLNRISGTCLKAYLQFGINLRVGLNKRLPDV